MGYIGGFGSEGIANLIAMRGGNTEVGYVEGNQITDWSKLTDKGYPISYGTSFIYSLAFTEQGPQAQAFLTYGQKENPNSAEYASQTKRFAEKDWRDIYFTKEDVKANAKKSFVLTGN
ncbi:penicillin acylase family protein [Thalassotalea crassostreae]|uniref:penicillin acylase family protein n=1 Tax=Thalassotalea crassostreae TaxID=1763536 RepID=UPI000837FFA8|nr:penicillin acylase family protein [Thalassotalea crassostreae]